MSTEVSKFGAVLRCDGRRSGSLTAKIFEIWDEVQRANASAGDGVILGNLSRAVSRTTWIVEGSPSRLKSESALSPVMEAGTYGQAVVDGSMQGVLSAISGGMSRRALASRFGVSAAIAVRWAALQRDHGKPAAKPQAAARARRRSRQGGADMGAVRGHPDITLAELRTALPPKGRRPCGAFHAPPHAQERPATRKSRIAPCPKRTRSLIRRPARP